MASGISREPIGFGHAGFSVHGGKPIKADDTNGRRTLSEYISRAPFSLDRMRFKEDSDTVLYRGEHFHPGLAGNFDVTDLLEWIARITSHIPKKGSKQIIYYGAYSQAWRGRDLLFRECVLDLGKSTFLLFSGTLPHRFSKTGRTLSSPRGSIPWPGSVSSGHPSTTGPQSSSCMWIFEADSPSAFMGKLRDYTLQGRVADIHCPVLVIDSAADSTTGGQARMLFDSLSCEKSYILFTDLQGADQHCQMVATRVSNEIMFAWLNTLKD